MVDCPISILACWSQFVAKGGDKGGERERYIYIYTHIYIYKPKTNRKALIAGFIAAIFCAHLASVYPRG
jgi:hypothetical protein